MKRLFWGACVALFTAGTAAIAADTPSIGFMEFKVSQGVDPVLGELLYGLLTYQFASSGNYAVVEWEKIEGAINAVKEANPEMSEGDARRLAVQQLGVQRLYLGSVSKAEGEIHASVTVLNLDLSVDRFERIKVPSVDDLDPAIVTLANRLQGIEEAPAVRPSPAPAKISKEPLVVYKNVERDRRSVSAFRQPWQMGDLHVYTDRMEFVAEKLRPPVKLVMPFEEITEITTPEQRARALCVVLAGGTERFVHGWKSAGLSKHLPERLARMIRNQEAQ